MLVRTDDGRANIEAANTTTYSLRRVGRPYTKDYTIYFEQTKDGTPVSPFHDISLYHDKHKGIFNMISRSKSLNPITQDREDDGSLRFNRNIFTYKGYLWNYGALPQLIVIDVNDPLVSKLSDIDDVERYFPGLLDATRDWFRIYKIPEGHDPNDFAFAGMYRSKKYALKIVGEYNDAWKGLVKGKIKPEKVSLDNTTLKDTPGKLDPKKIELPPDEELSPVHLDKKLDDWYFVDRKTWKESP
ncbi:inorganic pyrophosphatase [Podospora fimiseda]|uniref:inorganic diphosphatase n=1 Tax=Podospora fimiseda TaxID=252190 RepID=A0AAN7BFC2_9PEZI|nr:inorganic pyrophosphatase [Podospora fimiseda]